MTPRGGWSSAPTPPALGSSQACSPPRTRAARPSPPLARAPQLPSLPGSLEAMVVMVWIALQLRPIQKRRKDLLKIFMVTMTHLAACAQRQLRSRGRGQPPKSPAALAEQGTGPQTNTALPPPHRPARSLIWGVKEAGPLSGGTLPGNEYFIRGQSWPVKDYGASHPQGEKKGLFDSPSQLVCFRRREAEGGWG